MDCYVYYKTAQEHEPLLLQQINRIREILAYETGVALCLQRRPETSDGMITWMEIYRQIPAAFDARLAAILNQTEIMHLIHGERHAEYFMDAATCV